MKRVIFLILSIYCLSITAQERTKNFELEYSYKRIDKSPYSNIIFLDSREDTSSYGVVRTGRLNKETKVKASPELSIQMKDIFDSLIESKSGNNELVIQLRQLKLVEKTENRSEYGYVFFRANAYAKVNQEYFFINMIDTIVQVEANNDVTNILMDASYATVSKFFGRMITDTYDPNKPITYEGILKIDSIEKASIRLYTTNTYVDGIYRSYSAFKDQNPDYSLYSITFEDGDLADIKGKNRRGKIKHVKSKNIYAIVNKGVPYISAEFGFYPLVKKQNDFYFVGDGKLSPSNSRIIKTNSFFGITEYEAVVPFTSVFEIKVDHLNGRFMRVREIKEQ